jgi:hypothetical protein
MITYQVYTVLSQPKNQSNNCSNLNVYKQLGKNRAEGSWKLLQVLNTPKLGYQLLKIPIALAVLWFPITVSLVYCSRNSDSLHAGRFRVRTPVGERFSTPVQTGPGVHSASCTRNTGSLSRERSGQGVAVIITPISCQG